MGKIRLNDDPTVVARIKAGLKQTGGYCTVTMAGSLGYLAERVRNFRLIKSAAAEQAESANGNATFKRMYKTEFLSWLMVAGYQLASGLFSIMFIFIIFVLGGRLVHTGELTIGDLTAFYMITGIVGLQLMQFFMNVGSVSASSSAACRR